MNRTICKAISVGLFTCTVLLMVLVIPTTANTEPLDLTGKWIMYENNGREFDKLGTIIQSAGMTLRINNNYGEEVVATLSDRTITRPDGKKGSVNASGDRIDWTDHQVYWVKLNEGRPKNQLGVIGHYCSVRTGMMYEVSARSAGVIDPNDFNKELGLPKIKKNALGISKFYPNRDVRSVPVEVVSTAGIVGPYKKYATADGKLTVTLETTPTDPAVRIYTEISQNDMATIKDGDPLAIFKYNMPGFVSSKIPYADPDNFQTGAGFDEMGALQKVRAFTR